MALCAVLCAANAIKYQAAAHRYDVAATEYRSAAECERSAPDSPMEETDAAEPDAEEMENAAVVEVMEPEPVLEVMPEDAIPVIDFDALRAVNPDVVGWLYCYGTGINFPILQTADRDKYPGCVFSETEFLRTSNTVIYGPSPEDGAMFGTLLGYKEQDFYEAHPEIWLLTPEENHRIHLLGGKEVHAGDPFFSPSGRLDAENQMLRVMEASTFCAPAHLRGHLVTLSTSADQSSTSRFVVFGLTK